MVLATNESLYAWMDEGFTNYAAERVQNFLEGNPLETNRNYYRTYFYIVNKKEEEPLTTHADHFVTNRAYSIASYIKGSIFLDQLGYIVGDKVRDEILLAYFQKYKFKHPTCDDLIKIAEQVSGMQLKWYKELWVNSIKTIDFGISNVSLSENDKTKIEIMRSQEGVMPLDLLVTLTNDKKVFVHIPLYYTYASKTENPIKNSEKIVLEPQSWISPKTLIEIPLDYKSIKEIQIDPTSRMADINPNDNSWKK